MEKNLAVIKKTALMVKVPKEVENSYEKFTSFFNDLHKFIKDRKELSHSQKTISIELVLRENYLHYFIILEPILAHVVKSLLFTRFPDTEIMDLAPPELPKTNTARRYKEYKLKHSNYLPLRMGFTYQNDPYLTLSAVLSKLEHFNEGIIIQILISPGDESWNTEFVRQNLSHLVGRMESIKLFLEKPFISRETIDYETEMQKKFAHGEDFFYTNIRIAYYGQDELELHQNVMLLEKAFEKFRTGEDGNINELVPLKMPEAKIQNNFTNRTFSPHKMLLNVKEIATLYHFPNTATGIEAVEEVKSKKIEPPKELPVAKFLTNPEISTFARTWSRGNSLEFGVKRLDRGKHLYIVGKTGMGKSGLIELLTISDIYQDQGFCVIDPHGDLVNEILRYIPERRVKDVIYFNPADSEFPIGFNPLECFSPEDKHQVVTGFVSIFKKLFAATWTNRLEHVLRFTVLALIEAGDATIVDIVKLLTDINFRQQVVKKIQDPMVKNFWTHEFSSWNERFDNEAVIPIINQVGQFLSNDYIRNVVGQRKSRIDFFKSMNEGKIIIINLAKGKLGEENASLLGSMMITKIQEAAMARIALPKNQRRPFYLYVDEFQNFATESFDEILSEARKFNLFLTIAHQYIDQLTEAIRKTAFGNIGSIICFRVGSEDAHFLGREFAPYFTPDDIISLDFREACVKLSIDGKTSDPFSSFTIEIPTPKENHVEEIIAYSRQQYSLTKKEVEKEMYKDSDAMTHIAGEQKVDSSEADDTFDEPLIN